MSNGGYSCKHIFPVEAAGSGSAVSAWVAQRCLARFSECHPKGSRGESQYLFELARAADNCAKAKKLQRQPKEELQPVHASDPSGTTPHPKHFSQTTSICVGLRQVVAEAPGGSGGACASLVADTCVPGRWAGLTSTFYLCMSIVRHQEHYPFWVDRAARTASAGRVPLTGLFTGAEPDSDSSESEALPQLIVSAVTCPHRRPGQMRPWPQAVEGTLCTNVSA